MQAQIRTPTVDRLFEQSAQITTLKPAVRMAGQWRQQGLAYRRLRKRILFAPPWGLGYANPRNFREEGLWGPRFLKSSFLELEAVLL